MLNSPTLFCFVSCAVAVLLFGADAVQRPPPECDGHTCPDSHPILKYNGTCFCETHPCNIHTCDEVAGFPHLTYEYDSKGTLDCYCAISCPDNLCAGQRVPPECSRKDHHCPNPSHPIMVFEKDECMCKTHPCVVAGRGACPNADMPWLDFSYDQNGTLDCFCRPDPCKEHVCEAEGFPYARWDQEGHCYCSDVAYEPAT